MTTKRSSIRQYAPLALFLAILAVVSGAHAATTNVTLAWDANTETNLAGYRVYYGTASGSYSGSKLVAANVTTTTISNLTSGQVYYFAATATNAAGLESASSAEVVYTAPVAPNTAPVAIAQSLTTSEDTAKAITLTGSDADGNPLSFSIVASPSYGTLSGTLPNITYTPTANFNGNDSFTFKANDGLADSAAATVTVSVTPVNDAPVAIAQSVSTTEDVAKAITLAGSDLDGNTLTYSIVASPLHGTVIGTAPNLTYLPATNYNGSDSFTFKVNDGTVDSATATVSISVSAANDAPIAVAQSVSTSEDVAKAITLTASDVDGNTLTYAIVAAPAHGTLSGTAPNLTYLPATNYSGSDSFTFRANDGTVGSAAATVSITVTPVNDAPVAVAQSVSATEDTAKTITLTATDADGDALTYAIVAAPAHGTLSGAAPNLTYLPATNYSGADSFTFKANDGTVDSAPTTVSINVTTANDAPVAIAQSVSIAEDTSKGITLTATDADGNTLSYSVTAQPAHGTLSGTAPNLTYTPTANYNGNDSFAFKANDGTADSAAATVSITVTPVNDAPIAVAQSVSTAEDTAKAITLAASDADGDALTFAVVATPTHGSLSGTPPNLTYVPAANYNGADSFTFKANDGTVDSATVTVSINITAVNDAPLAVAQSVATAEDTAKAITLSATDVDGNTLTYAVVGAPAHGTLSGTAPNLTYTPTANYNGSDSFTFKANDGTVDSTITTVAITVTAVNDTPVASAQSVATDRNVAKAITLAGTDVDNDTLTFIVVTQPTKGVLSGTAPDLLYTPNNNVTGTDSFTFKVNDGTVDSAVASVSINIAAGPNTAPVALAQTISTPEDTAKSITLAGTDTDGDTLSYSVVTGPAHGTLSGNAPNLTYTPALNYNGSDSLTFRVNDGTTNSPTATVSITAEAVNDAPIASAQVVTTAEDTAKAITLTGSDVDGDALTYAIVTGPAHGTLSGSAPNLTYTPAANYNGADSFTFKLNDGTVDSTVATVSINVTAVNDAPVASAQSVTTAEDTAKAITLTATDTDGNTLSYSIVAQPAHGTLSGTAPNVTYTPATNYNGADSFTFKANDGTVDSATATVLITVTPVNDTPLATAQSVSTVEDTAKAITLAASDADSDTLTFSIVTAPTHGTLSGAAPNVTYLPATNYNGTDSFTFKVNDGTVDSATATVSINITAGNDAPVAIAQNVTADEDIAKTITLAATDVDGNTLTYAVTAAPAHGSLSGAAPNLTYTPAANYNGSDSFTFKANDGTVDSAPATVSLTVNPVNDTPVATAQSVATVEDTAKAITLLGTDVDGDTLAYSIVTTPTHGTLSGTAPNLTYLPATNYNGSDSFTFKVNDGTVDSTPATVAINIAPGNDAPIAISQSVTATEDTAKAITLSATDVDGNPLTYTVTAAPAHGALSGSAPNLTYTPTANYNGSDSFTFKANDGTVDSLPATVSITVAAVNDAPVASGQSIATDKNVAKSVTLAATDVDNDTLTYTVVAQPTKGTLSGTAPNLTYTPNFSVTGTDSFTFKANDGTVDSAIATIAINIAAGPNTAPVADAQNVTATEDVAKPITLTASDVDGDTLSYTVTTAPVHGTLSGTAPNLTYLPATNYNGSDSFWFRANDGLSNSALAVVSITVNPANDAPVASSQSTVTAEDTAKAITLSATDVDGDALTYTIVVAPAHGALSGTAPNVTYTPATNYNGSDSFTFKANDGTVDSATATVSITVTPVNDKPVAAAQNVAAAEDTTKVITLGGSDMDGNSLTYTVVTQPAHGTLSGTAPNLSYNPATNYNGADSFTFKVNDGTVDSANATVSITVAPVNDAPLATAQSVTTDKNVAKAITLGGSDVDGDTLTFAVVTQPTKGTLSGTAPGLTYTPNNNVTGTDSFTFKANDGTADSAVATVSINIAPGPNTAPVADAQSITATEDASKPITLTATDADGDPLTYTVTTAPAHGTLSGAAPNLTYLPVTNYSGSDSFVFRANDGLSNSALAVVSITVNPANDAPAAISQSIITVEDTAKSITLAGSDVDGDTLSFTVTVPPSHGTLSGAGANLTYLPATNYSGSDSFSFKANDGTVDSTAATVSIVVTPANDAPTANAQNVAAVEDATKSITLTGADVDGNPITYAVLTQPAHGSLSGTAPNLSYQPATNYNGSDSFTFRVNDGTVDSASATVSITVAPVNDAPVATAQSVATDKNVAKSVTLTATDVDGDTLTYVVVAQPTKGALSGTAPNLTYTPNNNITGTDSFTFKANDGTVDSAMTTIAINIAAGPNAAPVAEAQSVTATEDVAKAITLAATDADGDALSYTVTTAPEHGTLSGTAPNLTYLPATNYNGSDSFWFRANDGLSNSALAVVSITVNPANDAPTATSQSITTAEDTTKAITLAGSDIDGDTLSFTVTVPPSHGTLSGSGANLTYLPATNYNGSDSFSFKANDGTADSTTATVAITVTPVNDAPSAAAQNVAAVEDTTKAITLSGSDVDGSSITYTVLTQPAHGTLSGSAPNLSYKPATNYNGGDGFTFKVNDGSLDSAAATVSITVAPANDAPLAIEQSVATDKNVAKAITLGGSDIDGDALTYSVATQPTKGTLSGTAPNLTYTPNNNVTGADVFTFKANDGTVDSPAAAVYININAGPNTAPVAVAQDVTTAEDTAKAITLVATDADGNAITYSIVTPPVHGTLSGTAPNLTFTPTPDYSGSDNFWFTASDGATDSVPAVVSITITPVNDAPTLNTLGNVSLAAGAGAQTVSLSGITAGSNESQPLTVIADSSNRGLIPTPTVNYASPAATGSLSFTPVAGASGTAIVSVTVDDGQSQNSSVTRSFTVTVNASNGVPSITLTSPTNDASYASPATIHISASASAPGHTLTKVQFYAGTNLVNEDSSAPYEFDWTALNAGSYSIVARLIYDGSSTVDSAAVNVLVEDLPEPWAAGDIGNVATTGTVTVTNGVYMVEGAGVLSSTSDSCRYVYQPLSGDGEMKICINSVCLSTSTADTTKNSRAGVMIRESMTPGAKYAFAGISSDGLLRWQTRNATGGKTTVTSARGGAPGTWIRLVRNGKTITSYRSYDGVKWSRLASVNISMAPNIYIGIAVASGSPSALTTSKLTSPTVVP